MTRLTKWQRYEIEKRRLLALRLTATEYERKIKELAKRLRL